MKRSPRAALFIWPDEQRRAGRALHDARLVAAALLGAEWRVTGSDRARRDRTAVPVVRGQPYCADFSAFLIVVFVSSSTSWSCSTTLTASRGTSAASSLCTTVEIAGENVCFPRRGGALGD